MYAKSLRKLLPEQAGYTRIYTYEDSGTYYVFGDTNWLGSSWITYKASDGYTNFVTSITNIHSHLYGMDEDLSYNSAEDMQSFEWNEAAQSTHLTSSWSNYYTQDDEGSGTESYSNVFIGSLKNDQFRSFNSPIPVLNEAAQYSISTSLDSYLDELTTTYTDTTRAVITYTTYTEADVFGIDYSYTVNKNSYFTVDTTKTARINPINMTQHSRSSSWTSHTLYSSFYADPVNLGVVEESLFATQWFTATELDPIDIEHLAVMVSYQEYNYIRQFSWETLMQHIMNTDAKETSFVKDFIGALTVSSTKIGEPNYGTTFAANANNKVLVFTKTIGDYSTVDYISKRSTGDTNSDGNTYKKWTTIDSTTRETRIIGDEALAVTNLTYEYEEPVIDSVVGVDTHELRNSIGEFEGAYSTHNGIVKEWKTLTLTVSKYIDTYYENGIYSLYENGATAHSILKLQTWMEENVKTNFFVIDLGVYHSKNTGFKSLNKTYEDELINWTPTNTEIFSLDLPNLEFSRSKYNLLYYSALPNGIHYIALTNHAFGYASNTTSYRNSIKGHMITVLNDYYYIISNKNIYTGVLEKSGDEQVFEGDVGTYIAEEYIDFYNFFRGEPQFPLFMENKDDFTDPLIYKTYNEEGGGEGYVTRERYTDYLNGDDTSVGYKVDSIDNQKMWIFSPHTKGTSLVIQPNFISFSQLLQTRKHTETLIDGGGYRTF